MIKTSKQLKDLIRNLSKEKSANAQILIRNYMMERFLERISLSEYRDNFILKGGMLVAAMDEAEYPGIRVSMETLFDGVVTPLKIDISTGDIITPREVQYNFKLMLGRRQQETNIYSIC